MSLPEYFVTCFHVINYANDENVAKQTRIWVLPATMLVPIEVELVSYLEKEDVAVLKYTHKDILASLEGMVPITASPMACKPISLCTQIGLSSPSRSTSTTRR